VLILLMWEILEVRRWEGLWWVTFKPVFMMTGSGVQVWEAAVSVFLFGGTSEVWRRDGFMWHDIHTNFHEDWFIFRFLLQQFQRLERWYY
jgi:hypothetical protein